MPMTFTLNVNGKFCFIKTVVDGSKIGVEFQFHIILFKQHLWASGQVQPTAGSWLD